MTTTDNIILTTGIYDLIKDQIRRKKVAPEMGNFLSKKLENAVQIKRVELPEDVVTTDTRVTLKNGTDQQEEVYVFVAPKKAKKKHKTWSILSDVGLAVVGYREGDSIEWPSAKGVEKLKIAKVEKLNYN